jgi:hypothetical protein
MPRRQKRGTAGGLQNVDDLDEVLESIIIADVDRRMSLRARRDIPMSGLGTWLAVKI